MIFLESGSTMTREDLDGWLAFVIAIAPAAAAVGLVAFVAGLFLLLGPQNNPPRPGPQKPKPAVVRPNTIEANQSPPAKKQPD